MRQNSIFQLLEENPIIAAVKDWQGLDHALSSECRVIFSLFGDLCNVAEITARVKSEGKLIFLHVDLIDGLASRDISIDFIANSTKADGILSTKPSLIRRAGSCGLLAIQRYFLLDSMAVENIKRQYSAGGACAIEILPGVIPKITAQLAAHLPIPIIAGGLITDKEDVMAALNAGARAVSSTRPEVWFM